MIRLSSNGFSCRNACLTENAPTRLKKAYFRAKPKAVVAANVPMRPVIRWQVDPDDFVRPMAYDPDDERWANPDKERRLRKFCK